MLRDLIERCSNEGTTVGKRDAAILALLGEEGFRRPQVSAAYIDSAGLKIRSGISEPTGFLISQWLDVRGRHPGPLFIHVLRGDHQHPIKLSSNAVRDIVLRRSKYQLSPKKLYSLYIQNLANSGLSIAEVKRKTGCKSADTILRYLGGGENVRCE